MAKYSSFDDYIKSKTAPKGTTHTHTRIGNKDLKIYGGSYNVNDEDNETFLSRYYKKVFENGNEEYLTEKQLIEDGPIPIDIDLRYKPTVTKKKHSVEHIVDLVMCYADKIDELLDIPEDAEVDVYVMEKSTVNQLKDKTKDGIHIIFGISMHKGLQVMLRNRVIPELANMWGDLPIINTWNEVVDEGIAKGQVNWQVYGSKKPGNKAYLITQHYTLTYSDNEWNFEENDMTAFNTQKHLPKMSVRCTSHPKFPMKESLKDTFEVACKSLGRQKPKLVMKKSTTNMENIAFDKINNMEKLDSMIEEWMDDISHLDYKIKETHQYAVCLPEEYYAPGSYTKWLRVGWALANTSQKMFLTWLKISAQSTEFDWNDVPDMYTMWRGFDFNNKNGLTHRSIMYWCKNDAREKYDKIHKESIDNFIDQTVNTVTEFDLGQVLFYIYKATFVCTSIKHNHWYEYRSTRWVENESGNTLYMHISRTMHDQYVQRTVEITNQLQLIDQGTDRYHQLQKKAAKLAEVSILLKRSSWKKNIMKEAAHLFYDGDFLEKLDQNPYLLGCNNYVIDFTNKTYRIGQPDDYIEKSTKIDYILLDQIAHAKIIKSINNFMEQLFPNPNLRQYMWEHLASTLIGKNISQTFNMYMGNGANGKSILVKLMEGVLGEYQGKVPISLITQERPNIGTCSSEIAQLKGLRYAVMQEPRKGTCINEGIMKELTGGDPIMANPKHKEPITFCPQMQLAVTANVELGIKSNDDGTWRRIRKIDFESKFVDNPYGDEFKYPKEECPYQYQRDNKIEERFAEWGPIFLSMLVEIAYEKQGVVNDCEEVLASSKEYREGQDVLTLFAKDKILKKKDGKVKKFELYETFKGWYIPQYGRGVPKSREIYEYMDKRFGRFRKGGWHNIEINYEDENEIEDEEE